MRRAHHGEVQRVGKTPCSCPHCAQHGLVVVAARLELHQHGAQLKIRGVEVHCIACLLGGGIRAPRLRQVQGVERMKLRLAWVHLPHHVEKGVYARMLRAVVKKRPYVGREHAHLVREVKVGAFERTEHFRIECRAVALTQVQLGAQHQRTAVGAVDGACPVVSRKRAVGHIVGFEHLSGVQRHIGVGRGGTRYSGEFADNGRCVAAEGEGTYFMARQGDVETQPLFQTRINGHGAVIGRAVAPHVHKQVGVGKVHRWVVAPRKRLAQCLPHLGHVVQTAHASGYLCHGRSRSVIAGGGLETAPHGVVGAHGFGGVEFGCLQEQFGVFRRYVHVRRVELRGPAEFGAVGRVALVAQVGHSVDEDIGSLAACGVFVP